MSTRRRSHRSDPRTEAVRLLGTIAEYRLRSEIAEAAKLPHDIAWEPIAENLIRIGFSASLPNSYFLALDTTPHRFTLVNPERRFLDEVAELVAEFAARSPADDAKFNIARDTPWGQVQQRGVGAGKYQSGEPNLAQRDEEILREAVKGRQWP